MSKDMPEFGLDPDGLSKRRISSILKAPRTSMKGFGADQDEEEETKTIEKRRNSRRVSFATTNNVHLFEKDIKSEYLQLASVQNSAIGADDGQNKRTPDFDRQEEQLIPGLDTFPLSFSHPKENFFSDPFLQDGPMDRTVLLGDETGCMDMTRSHTVCIENDDKSSLELTLSNSANGSSLHGVKAQNCVLLKTFSDSEKDPLRLKFFEFLSSLSKPVASSKPEPMKCRTNSSNVEMDKENIFPTRLSSLANPEPQGQRSRGSNRVSFEQSMDMTRSHTVLIDRKDAAQNNCTATGLTSWCFAGDSDDMELTRSQTATINFKAAEGVQSTGRHQSTSGVSVDDTSAMVMTQVLDSVETGRVLSSQQKRVASGPQPDVSRSSKQIRRSHFQSDGQFPMSNSDDMDLTRLQTTIFQSRFGEEPFCKTSFGDDMEMTRSQTVILESKPFEKMSNSNDMEITCLQTVELERKYGGKPFLSNGNNMDALSTKFGGKVFHPTNNSHDMDMTQSQTTVLETKFVGEPLGKMSNSDDLDILKTKFREEPFHKKSNSDHIDMTRSQSVVLESKFGDKPFQKTSNSNDMEIICLQTVELERKYGGKPFLSNGNNMDALSTKFGGKVFHPTNNSHDMDMTQSQTTVLETKFVGEPLGKMSNSDDLDILKTRFREEPFHKKSNSDHIDMTRSQSVVLESKFGGEPFCKMSTGPSLLPAPSTSCEAVRLERGSGPLATDNDQSEFMELTCETVVLPPSPDEMNSSGCAMVAVDSGRVFQTTVKPNKRVSVLAQTVSDDCMESARCQTTDLDDKSCVAYNRFRASFQTDAKDANHNVSILPKKKKIENCLEYRVLEESSPSDGQDDMEQMECRTVAIEAEDVQVSSALSVHLINMAKTEMAAGVIKKTETATEVGGKNSASDLPDMASTSMEPLDCKGRVASSCSNVDDCKMNNTGDQFAMRRSCAETSEATFSGDPNKETVSSLMQRSLTGLQVRLESNTAPVVGVAGASSPQPSKETRKEALTPFNLKNSLVARLSLGAGTLPRLPQAKSPGTNLMVTPHLGPPQNLCHDIEFLNDEVIPDEDFSTTMLSAMEMVMTSTQCPNAIQNSNASALVPRVIYDTSSSSSAISTKCDGSSESTLRNSQVEATLDCEFDFYEKLEDGSLTVGEFLKHFGTEFVIHKSRPSALPDTFRAAQPRTTQDVLEDKHVYHPKQRIYEADCRKLTEMAEGLKTQMAELEKPLMCMNGALLQDVSALSEVQLQKFGARLKEQRLCCRKSSKVQSHEMKKALYSELLKTTLEAKQSLNCRVKETNDILKELDGCMSELQSELEGTSDVVLGDEQFLIKTTPALKSKRDELDALEAELVENERETCKLELQAQTLEESQGKLQIECMELERRTSTLSRLNEWRFKGSERNRAVFTFLHDTMHLEVKLRNVPETECMQTDMVQDMEVSCNFLLNGELSQCHAVMVHKLLADHIQSQNNWTMKYPTTRHLPLLLHDVGLVVSRLRLLGEEIHQLKNWGGLRLDILHITCIDTSVDLTFSSLKAFVKFQLRLALTPDYPFGPVRVQSFQNYIGTTRVDQIEKILSTVAPAKDYLTRVIKRIHADLLG